MPYCFDFSFNFHFWLMSFKKKKQQLEGEKNGKEKEDPVEPGFAPFMSAGLGGPTGAGFLFWLARVRSERGTRGVTLALSLSNQPSFGADGEAERGGGIGGPRGAGGLSGDPHLQPFPSIPGSQGFALPLPGQDVVPIPGPCCPDLTVCQPPQNRAGVGTPGPRAAKYRQENPPRPAMSSTTAVLAGARPPREPVLC